MPQSHPLPKDGSPLRFEEHHADCEQALTAVHETLRQLGFDFASPATLEKSIRLVKQQEVRIHYDLNLLGSLDNLGERIAVAVLSPLRATETRE